MPKQQKHTKSKNFPYKLVRRASVRQAENFDELLEKFEGSVTMGDNGDVGDGGVQELVPKDPGKGGADKGGVPSKPPEVVSDKSEAVHDEAAQAEAATLANALGKLRARRVEIKKLLLSFSNATVVTRRMLNELGEIVTRYKELEDIEREIARKYRKWLVVCGKEQTELEQEENPLCPSIIDKEIDEAGELLDKVEEIFKLVKQKYTEKQAVIDYLDFVESDPKQLEKDKNSNASPTNSDMSQSAALGKGEEYLKTKIPILRKEVENRYKTIKEQFESKSYTTESSLQDAIKKLESIDNKITEDSTFEKLLRELFEFSREEFDQHEEWRQLQLALIASLNTSLETSIEERRVANTSEKARPASSYSTFFKKQEPPKFKGDCLDYLEFKKKWASQVNSHNPPVEFEIDLLKKNIPEEGKKKLYEVETLNAAWKLLDNLYGDERLICQKLKLR